MSVFKEQPLKAPSILQASEKKQSIPSIARHEIILSSLCPKVRNSNSIHCIERKHNALLIIYRYLRQYLITI